MLLEQILFHTPAAIFWKDTQGVYRGCNQLFLNMAGLKSLEDIVGAKDSELPWKDRGGDYNTDDFHVMKTGQTLKRIENVLCVDGEIIAETTKTPLYEGGKIVGVLCLIHDITDFVNAKKAAEAASRAKTEFIANMSHDLRTPVTGVLGMAQDIMDIAQKTKISLQKHMVSLPSDQQSTLINMIETIQEDGRLLFHATDELLQLCNEILEITRLESDKQHEAAETFDLRALIEHNITLLQPVAQNKTLNLSCEIDPTVPRYLHGIRQYLDRTILNLISNALKFTKKGFVKVVIKNSESKKTHFKIGDTLNLIIQVADSGIGIPEDKFDVIFEHFSRLVPSYEGIYQGAGLGLYTVKCYVKAMHGTIHLTSELGKGTVFTLTLPFIVADHVKKEKTAIFLPKQIIAKKNLVRSAVIKSTDKHRILIVEDNELAAKAITLALEKIFDCSFDFATTGKQAIQMAGDHDYDLILMDVGLPDLNGVEATKRIRDFSDKNKSSVPIIALTGHAGDPEKYQECIDAGMQVVLSKPARQPDLKAVFQEYVFSPMIGDEENLLQENSVIDWDACLQMCEGNEKIVREILDILKIDLNKTRRELDEFVVEKNTSAMREELYRLSRSIDYLKLPQLEQTLQAFYETLDEEQQNDVDIAKTYRELYQAIDMLLNKLANI